MGVKEPRRDRRVRPTTWLKKWVPLITSSPAIGKDGALVITFDESDHYRLLASIYALFGPPYLGYAATPGLNRFGLDV